MRVLIVKLSSLGDVVHALPVVHDIRVAHPGAAIDWAVEPAFAPLLARVVGVGEVIECPLRRWAVHGWLSAETRRGIGALRRRLRRDRYDAVVDLQGLTKSAIVAALARGPSWSLANRTRGSSFEWPARALATHAVRVDPDSHAIDRSRALVARALATRPEAPPVFGLGAARELPADPARVALIHGSSRADKLWPEASWIELGRRLLAAGRTVALPRIGGAEHDRARRIAAALGPGCEVWPGMTIGDLIDRLAGVGGAIGVDSGPSHIATALGLPQVQIYNHPTAWRTGPQARHGSLGQVSVEAMRGPAVDAVWSAWQDVAVAVAVEHGPAASAAVARDPAAAAGTAGSGDAAG